MAQVTRHLVEALSAHLSGRPVPIPEAGRLAWRWFLDLCRTRGGSGSGPNPISYADIEAYARLYRWPLEPRHTDLILALDRVWLNHTYSGNGSAPKSGVDAETELTPAAFDAVF